MSDLDPFDDEDDDMEEWDEALEDCGMFPDGEVVRCLAIGSEECDFGCPFRNLVGQHVAVLDADQDEFDAWEMGDAVDEPSTPSTIDPFDEDDLPF